MRGGQMSPDSMQTGTTLIDVVQRDHREIERLLEVVDRAIGLDRRQPFEQLVRKLAVHETAEEIVVHPLTKGAGANAVADEVLHEEDQAKKALAALDGMDVTSPEFARRLSDLKRDVLSHAHREEYEE